MEKRKRNFINGNFVTNMKWASRKQEEKEAWRSDKATEHAELYSDNFFSVINAKNNFLLMFKVVSSMWRGFKEFDTFPVDGARWCFPEHYAACLTASQTPINHEMESTSINQNFSSKLIWLILRRKLSTRVLALCFIIQMIRPCWSSNLT